MAATKGRRALGRGLDALLSPEAPSAVPEKAPAAALAEAGERLNQVPVADLYPGVHQPRTDFDDESLKGLSESVKRHGILQPILVRSSVRGYEIVAGERRWRAAREAGLETVPVISVEAAGEKLLEISVVENVQRADLNPMEVALAFSSMMERLGVTQEELAARVGKERSTVANYLRLLNLPPAVQESVAAGLLSMGHARALLSLRSPVEIERFAEEAAKKRLSVRQLEDRVRKVLTKTAGLGARRRRAAKEEGPRGPQAIFLREQAERLRGILGTKVTIDGDEKSGKLIIDYYSKEMLEGLIDRMV